MLGASGVGKTSLVARYVKSIFSEKYHTTVGVKIEKKVVQLSQKEVTLILWDLAGDDEYSQLKVSYLRGTSGYLLVADATRRGTLDKAMELQEKASEAIATAPFILAINKIDLDEEWDLPSDSIENLVQNGWSVIRTSAKSGEGVEDLFTALAGKMIE